MAQYAKIERSTVVTYHTNYPGDDAQDDSKSFDLSTVNGAFEIKDVDSTDAKVTKIWNEEDNKYGKRPASITVHLYADEELVDEVVLNERYTDDEGNWSYTFTGLVKYRNGNEIAYTVDEEKVANYHKSIDGFTITNSYITPGPDTSDHSHLNLYELGLIMANITTAGVIMKLRKKEDD